MQVRIAGVGKRLHDSPWRMFCEGLSGQCVVLIVFVGSERVTCDIFHKPFGRPLGKLKLFKCLISWAWAWGFPTTTSCPKAFPPLNWAKRLAGLFGARITKSQKGLWFQMQSDLLSPKWRMLLEIDKKPLDFLCPMDKLTWEWSCQKRLWTLQVTRNWGMYDVCHGGTKWLVAEYGWTT